MDILVQFYEEVVQNPHPYVVLLLVTTGMCYIHIYIIYFKLLNSNIVHMFHIDNKLSIIISYKIRIKNFVHSKVYNLHKNTKNNVT